MKKRKKIFIVIPLIFVIIAPIIALFFTGYAHYANVSYGDKAEERVDIFIPHSAKNNENNGCLLFIHGGSWAGGDKAEESLKCRVVANQGYVTATMNYSVFSESNQDSYNVWLVMEQISKAFVKIQQFCKEKGVNITMGATAGYSAGGHLAMLYAYSQADKVPFKIAFTASLAGPADFSKELWGDSYLAIANRLLGKEVVQNTASENLEEAMNSVEPLSRLTKNAPPTLLAYGGRDDLVKAKNGEAMFSKCKELGVECDYLLFKHSKHLMLLDIFKRVKYNRYLGKYCRAYFGY